MTGKDVTSNLSLLGLQKFTTYFLKPETKSNGARVFFSRILFSMKKIQIQIKYYVVDLV
jgi:hypothetical protein